MKLIQIFCVITILSSLVGCSKDDDSFTAKTIEQHADFDKKEIQFLKEELQTSRIQQKTIDSIEKKLQDSQNRIAELQREVRELKSSIENPFSVTILGRVNNPGTYTSAKPMTILEAFGYAGGLSSDADAQRVVIKQAKRDTVEQNFENLLTYGRGGNHEIPSGMVFIVPKHQEPTQY